MESGKSGHLFIFRDELGAVVDHATFTVLSKLAEYGSYPHSNVNFLRIANYL